MARIRRYDKSFLLKLSEQDLRELRDKSRHAEVGCSDYLRQCIYGRPCSAVEIRALKKELQKIGVNLNQGIRAANQAGMNQQIFDAAKLQIDELKRVIQAEIGGVF